MIVHTDGFYEIEFQRMYRMQGRVLKRIRYLQDQLKCYTSKRAELKMRGIVSQKLELRIRITKERLKTCEEQRLFFEAEKEEVSVNKEANAWRAADSKIIEEAYACAYEPNMYKQMHMSAHEYQR